jgi:hypothetical protein
MIVVVPYPTYHKRQLAFPKNFGRKYFPLEGTLPSPFPSHNVYTSLMMTEMLMMTDRQEQQLKQLYDESDPPAGHHRHEEHYERGNPPNPNNNNHPHDWRPFYQEPSTTTNRIPSRRMDHTYQDYAYYSTGSLPMPSKTPSNFPSKLHHILSDPENHHVSRLS